MVTVLFSNGAKTFKQDPIDTYNCCDYGYLTKYLEEWIIRHNQNLDIFYNFKVKHFSRKLSSKGYMVKDFS